MTQPQASQRSHEVVLALLLAVEITTFCLTGTNFLSVENAFEIARLSVEVGLLALAMTLVIVTGGIDLSVGSLMGLSAVVFGSLWRDAGLPIPLAATMALLTATTAGGLNGLLITRLQLPPLIVTLGTFSLFRGLAEGLTRGVDNFTGFSDGFLFLGQGYMWGGVPTQLPILVVAAILFWALLQHSTIGRALYAIGYSSEGARYAGLPVERRVVLVYLLSSLAAGVAALVYVAHLGQAKADAGTGYELLAITAVVLGGTSIFGGRGAIQGTMLGLLTVVVLQNGLRLSDLPGELAGILIGVLLLATISIERIMTSRRGGYGARNSPASATSTLLQPEIPVPSNTEEFQVKNSQIVALSFVILAAALIVAASNWLAIRSLDNPGRGGVQTPVNSDSPSPTRRFTVAMMPKSKGNAYFIACRKGAEEAATELNVNLLWDGPTDPDPARQNELVDTWITRGVDVIAVAVENREGISSVLRKARQRGIKVITWDADAEPDSRDFLVNQATPQGIGYTLMDHAGRILGGQGEFAIITASLTAANMIEWQKHIEERRAEKYPQIKMAALRPCDDLQKKAFDEANTILNAYPNVKLIMAICAPAAPGAAEAVKQSGREDVKVLGLSLPNDNKRYVHAGITDAIVLWNTADLGYLTVYASHALMAGSLHPGDSSMEAGRLGRIEIAGDNLLLGAPMTFTRENIDQFNF